MTHLVVYCLLIVAASLFGGWLPSLITLTHSRMQAIMSAVGGLMLGIALFHMLPHAVHKLGSERIEFVTGCVMFGLMTMFFLLRTFHFHHHDPTELSGDVCDHDHDHDDHHHDDHGHDDHHRHDSEPASSGHAHDALTIGPHELSWMGVFLGLGLHTFIDGIAAASVESDMLAATNQSSWAMFGAATFLAILVHKPLDAVSITSLMSARHWSVTWKLTVTAAFALMCPLGAAVFKLGLARFSGSEQMMLGGALAFSAGALCISLSDLLPEMEFHSHHRLLLSTTLLAGIALAWLLHQLEPAHTHATATSPPSQTEDFGRQAD